MTLLEARIRRLKKKMLRKIELLENRLSLYSRRDWIVAEEIEDHLKKTNMQLLEVMTLENELWLRRINERTKRDLQQAS